jgi:hypothetical protein
MLVMVAAASLSATFLAMRLVRAGIGEAARVLVRPVLCSTLLAGALMVLVGPAESLSPIVTLLVLVVAGLLLFTAAALIFARPVLMPMWVSIRETRT